MSGIRVPSLFIAGLIVLLLYLAGIWLAVWQLYSYLSTGAA